MFLSDVSIRRPVFATMMMVALVVLGVVSYRRLAIDEYPDITYPVVIVNTTYPGASPEVMMREISKPIEEAVNTTQGIKEVTSTSLQGISLVRVQFNLGVDINNARQEVQGKVARIRRQLPPNTEDPIIQTFDPNASPIMSVTVQSDERSLRELTDMAEEAIATRFEAIPGVGAVNRVGGIKRVIRIQLDPDAMRAYGVSPTQVIAALDRENQEVPAGRVISGPQEQLVRITGRIADPIAFGDVAVTVRNGVAVKVRDVARVIDGTEDQRNASEIGDAPTVSLDILKISGSNTVEVADSVRVAAADLERSLPQDVRLRVIRDDSRRIRDSVNAVRHELLFGAVLTILIVYLFLNSWRSTVITGLTLPISIISSFFVMWVFDFTLNTMTLLALALSIGLLIDDAIVVRENIVRHLEMGKDHDRAAREGTSEIGLAVFSTTLAVVAVFVPVAFMGGMIGKIFFQFGVTVAFAVIVSLFVSFTLDPMLSSVWYDPEIESGGKAAAHGALHASGAKRRINPIRRMALAFNEWFERVSDRYPGWLASALRRRLLVLGVAAASIVGAVLLVPTLGFTWMPDVDGGEFNVSFRTTPGSSLEYTLAKGREIARLLEQSPEVEFTYLTVGGGFRGTPNNGSIFVRLKEKGQRSRSLAEIQDDLRGKLRTIPGVRPAIMGSRSIFGGYRQPIAVNVQGPEPTRLKLAAARVLDTMRAIPGVAEPQSSEEGEIPQLDVRVDRQEAWRAGLGIQSIAATLQPLFAGQRATRWEDPQGYSHDVLVVYPDSMRTSAADVGSISIPTLGGGSGAAPLVPLSQVAEVRAGVGPQQIERRALEQQISISAGVLPGYSMGDVANDVKAAIGAMGLPPGYRTVFTGDVQNLQETTGYVLEALGLAVVFIYLILASLFGSFLQPLAIMLALPLSFIGVALALLVTRGNINVMTMIGVIMLMGLVTKNGILLVDFTNQRRAEGVPRDRAILEAARIRLRPIIMTTVAMIFGMIPAALALGEGSEQRAPMARAVIGGLITSTLLTLFVVPVVYTMIDEGLVWVRRRRAVAAAPLPATGD
ncbi:MAG: efflux RND transporter permease subunit [Gemmatimonadaceae bacterium]